MNPIDRIQLMAVGTVLLLASGLGVVILRWLWLKTGRGASPTSDELDELRGRLAELEAERGHVAELEERLDFAERLLARQAETDRLAGGA